MKKLLLCIAILATDSFSALCVENATIRFGASSDMSATTLTTPPPASTSSAKAPTPPKSSSNNSRPVLLQPSNPIYQQEKRAKEFGLIDSEKYFCRKLRTL